MELMIGENFINNEDSIPIVIRVDKTVNSFEKGYHVYHDPWKPIINEELTTAIEPDNFVDKHAVCVRKNDVIVRHLPNRKNRRFTKMISYFLSADKYAKYKL